MDPISCGLMWSYVAKDPRSSLPLRIGRLDFWLCLLTIDTEYCNPNLQIVNSFGSVERSRLFYHYFAMHAFSKNDANSPGVISTRIVKGHEFEVCLRIQDMEIGLFIVRRIFPSQIMPIPCDYQVEREMRYAKCRKCEECKYYVTRW